MTDLEFSELDSVIEHDKITMIIKVLYNSLLITKNTYHRDKDRWLTCLEILLVIRKVIPFRGKFPYQKVSYSDKFLFWTFRRTRTETYKEMIIRLTKQYLDSLGDQHGN